MKKDGIVFYRAMIEALICTLPDDADDARTLLEAIVAFGLDGEDEPEMPRHLRAVWAMFKDKLSHDDEKYARIVERNRQNGARGGRPRKALETEKPNGFDGNPENPVGFLGNPENPENPKKPTTTTTTTTNEISLTRDNARAPACDNAPSCLAVPYPTKPSEVVEVATRLGRPMTEQQAQGFIDYYSATGWMMRGTRITDWRHKVGGWCDRQGEIDARKKAQPTAFRQSPILTERQDYGPTQRGYGGLRK